MSFLENELSDYVALDGEWSFSLAGSTPTPVVVPSAWERFVHDKRIDGPALYRRSFDLPADWLDGRRILFEAQAISFEVTVRVNGQEAGRHQGMWSRFQLDVSALVRAGQNEIELEIWKPGGRFPLRETLAGFLPDVCTSFGGPWQGVGLRAVRHGLSDLGLVWDAAGDLRVRGTIEPRAETIAVEMLDEAGQAQRQAAATPDEAGAFALTVPANGLRRWRPETPHLVTVTVTASHDARIVAQVTRRLGVRRAQVSGGATWLDDRPLHLRGVLDWGWHPDLIAPTPDRERVRRQFAQARSLGFNLVKLCLYVPDETTFAVADEVGMLLWLELPLWLPQVTPALKALALAEYAALLQRLHHHPSIVVLSLGCELQANAEAEFLRQLSALARHWLPHAIHCDNSGSAEAYGGVATNLSDVYDYHFYTDPRFFQPLVEHFDRGYRERKPWLYGEYCDVDTGRDFSKLDPLPWWLTDPSPLERDDYLVMRAGPQRLAEAGVTDGGRSLTRIAHRQATAIRKFIFEQTRVHDATGGYVISGWADTPITTSGIVDDQGALKFDPAEWRAFNADAVLLIDRERRRRWVGGDRPAPRDLFCYWAGERAEIHVLLSNGRGDLTSGKLRWSVTLPDGREWAAGETDAGALPGAAVREAAVAAWTMPMPEQVAGGGDFERRRAPLEMTFTARLEADQGGGDREEVANTWRLWVAPRVTLPQPLALAGPLRYDHGLWRLQRDFQVTDLDGAPLETPFLTDALTPEVLDRVRAGGRGLCWVRRPDSRFTRTLAFWREAVHVFEPHALWERVPHAGYADLRFYSVASDLALDLPRLQALLGPEARCRPLWRRFDARKLTWAEHLVEVEYGAGRLVVSGLRFEGGQGRQPETFDANPMGAWVLASLLVDQHGGFDEALHA